MGLELGVYRHPEVSSHPAPHRVTPDECTTTLKLARLDEETTVAKTRTF